MLRGPAASHTFRRLPAHMGLRAGPHAQLGLSPCTYSRPQRFPLPVLTLCTISPSILIYKYTSYKMIFTKLYSVNLLSVKYCMAETYLGPGALQNCGSFSITKCISKKKKPRSKIFKHLYSLQKYCMLHCYLYILNFPSTSLGQKAI